jgi:hypothetical protein
MAALLSDKIWNYPLRVVDVATSSGAMAFTSFRGWATRSIGPPCRAYSVCVNTLSSQKTVQLCSTNSWVQASEGSPEAQLRPAAGLEPRWKGNEIVQGFQARNLVPATRAEFLRSLSPPSVYPKDKWITGTVSVHNTRQPLFRFSYLEKSWKVSFGSSCDSFLSTACHRGNFVSVGIRYTFRGSLFLKFYRTWRRWTHGRQC